MKEFALNLLKKYAVLIIIVLIIILGIEIRVMNYNWPYLRNIDSYTFFRQMDEIVANNGVMPEYDPLVIAPYGVVREGGGNDFYVYAGAYSYMLVRFFIPTMPLWEFLIWFPPFLASLMAIPMYYIGKLLYDRKAGLLAALFVVFDTSVMSRTLGGDPDSDAIALLLPLVVIALFLFAYKLSSKNIFNKKVILYSVLGGIAMAAWGFTWGGHWWVVMLITGLIVIKMLIDFGLTRNIRQVWHDTKHVLMSYAIIMVIFFTLTIPVHGWGYIQATYLGPLTFQTIKAEEGGTFPNVYVSVQELQTGGDPRIVIQSTSLVGFDTNPGSILISTFMLTIYALVYLIYSFVKKRQHMDTVILLLIWFMGPFLATMTALRFGSMLSMPIILGSAIILSKAIRMATLDEKLED